MRFKAYFQLIFLAFVLLFPGLDVMSVPQDPAEAFEIGIEHYSNGRYEEAIGAWEKLILSGYVSHELYYNLGNANFKNGSIPGAILYYEKALLLRPFNEDIKYNLEIARSYITDSFETIPELFLVRWYKMVSLIFTSNVWSVLSLLLFIVTLVLLLIYLFSVKIGLKKLSFVLGILMLALSSFALSLSVQNSVLINKRQNAIVFAPAVTGKSSPDQSGKDLFLIHEGTKVRIEDELGSWYEVRLSDGNIGWVPAETVTKV